MERHAGQAQLATAGLAQVVQDQQAAVQLPRHADRRMADLSRLEFDLLRYLFEHKGAVCSREEIIGALYPQGNEGFRRGHL
jgi:DNA-binding response OmpR family regulator